MLFIAGIAVGAVTLEIHRFTSTGISILLQILIWSCLLVIIGFTIYRILSEQHILNNYFAKGYPEDLEIPSGIFSNKLLLLVEYLLEKVRGFEEEKKVFTSKLQEKEAAVIKHLKQHKTLSRETSQLRNELKLSYETLNEIRDKYENLIIHLQDEYYFYSLSTSGNVLYVSTSVKKLLGFSPKEYRAKRQELFTQHPMNEHARECNQRALEGTSQSAYMVELWDNEGKPHVFEVSEVPVFNENNQLVSVEGLAHDITERRRTEELILEQQEKYRGVFNFASDFVYLYEVKADGRQGKFIEANKYMLDNLGFTMEMLSQMSPHELCVNTADFENEIHPKREKYDRIWESGEGLFLTVEISEHSLMIANRRVIIAVARDITARKKSEDEIRFMNEELLNQKENLEALIDNLTQTQEQLVQSEKMAALGQLIAGVAHEINTPLGAIKASVENLSGSITDALDAMPQLVARMNDEDIDYFLSLFHRSKPNQNLSSREKRQKKREIRDLLNEQQINDADLIADYMVYLEIFQMLDKDFEHFRKGTTDLLTEVKNFVSIRKNTDTIFLAAEKATKVVFALKKYAHRDSLGEKVPTDINDGIETVLTLYHNQMKQGIEIVREFAQIPTIMCYQDELSQVWTNLIQNAIQAMKLQGTLTIRTTSDEKTVTVFIQDTGPGIGPDIIDKIFEPFFTTKKQGEGSGLGLDIVKKIIDKHGGEIHATSQLGEGATFIVKLPIL